MIFQLTDEIIFPHPSFAETDGLLAVGGDLSVERLLLAYQNGIFPWFNPGEKILWYATDPRFVLFPQKINVRKSMRQWMRNTKYSVTENKAFKEVILACRDVERKDQLGTWIGEDILKAYTNLFNLGYAKSVEVWINKTLVGGLYGVVINNCFFGESMFHTVSNASKLALIHLCQTNNYKVVDCQVYTEHLKKMGAEMILLDDFLNIIQSTNIES